MRRIGPLLMSTVLVAGCAGFAAKNESIRTLLEKSAQSQPKLSAYDQGKLQLQLGNAGLAIDSFQKELKENPQSVEALNGLAIAYDRLGRADVSQRFLDQALTVDPNSTVTLNNLAYLNLTQGNTVVALAYGERAKIAAGLPMEMRLADTIANAVNRNVEIANQLAMADSKPKSAAEIPNLPPERAVKRVGLNEWEIHIAPPMSGEALRVNLPKLDPVAAAEMTPQMPEPVMSSLLTPEAPPVVTAPLPVPQAEPAMETALPAQMTDTVVAALLEPKAAEPIVVAPAQPIIAAPVEPPQQSEPVAPTQTETVIALLPTPQAAEPVSAPLPAPAPKIAPPAPASVPAPQMPDSIMAALLAAPEKPVIAPLPAPQPEIVAPVPAPVEPQAAEVIVAPPPTEIDVAALPTPQVIEAAPQIVEPALQAIEPAPQAVGPAPAPVPELQIVEPAPAPQIPETIVASLLAPPSNPVLASLAPPRPAEPSAAPVTAPAASSIPGNVIAAPSAALTDMGPNLTWKAYVPAGTLVRVSNGTGRGRMAARFAGYFGEHGLSVRRTANANSYNYKQTMIFYNPDQRNFAYRLANLLPFPVKLVQASKGRGQVELILGFDLLDFDDTLRRL